MSFLKKKQFAFPQKRKLLFAVLLMVFVFSAFFANNASATNYRPNWSTRIISIPDNQTPQAFQTSDGKTLQGMSAYYNDPSKGYYNTPLQSVLFSNNTWYVKDGTTYKDASTFDFVAISPEEKIIKTTETTGFDPLSGQLYTFDSTGWSEAGGAVTGDWKPADQNAYDQQKNLQNKQDANSCGVNVACHLERFALWLSNAILWLFSWTVWLGAKMLDVALDMPRLLGGFTTAPIVKIGWPIVRDLANMFFSLILLVIAFATILRIESYGMKQVLWRLVIAALLINFSLVIAGVIIDGSNVLTTFFIKGNFTQANSNEPADISAAILNGLSLQKLYETTDTTLSVAGFQPSGGYMENSVVGAAPSGLQGKTGFVRILLTTILGTIFMLVTTFVLFAAAILFFIRLVVLWILLIFSPLAWLAMILPATKNLWSKWWSEFMKWIIFAPVYGFFIYLTVSMINKGFLSKMLVADQIRATALDQGLAISTFTQSTGMIVNYIIIIIFMVAGLIFARQTGITGAATFANFASNVGKGAGNFVGRATDRFLAEGAEKTGWQGAIRKPLSYLSPTAWKTGFQRRKAQRDREAFEVAGAARQDSINRFWGGFSNPKKWVKGGSDMQEYRERAKRARRQTERSEIKTNNAEELVAGFEKAKKEKKPGKMGAYAQTLSEQNDLNELFRHYAASGEDGWEMSAEGLEKFVNEKLIRDGGMDKQDGLRVGYDLMRMHEANGQWLGRIIKYDNNTGKYEWETADKDGNDKYEVARKNAYIEWSKQDPQAQARNTGRFSLVREGYRKEDGSGKGGETQIKQMTSNGQRMLAALDPSHAKRFQRHSSNLSVFHFDKELQQINPAVYNTLVEGHQTATKGMNTAQLDKYLAAQQGFIGSDPTTGQKRTPQWFQDIRAKAPAPGSGTGTAGAGGSAAGGGATGGYTGSGWGGP